MTKHTLFKRTSFTLSAIMVFLGASAMATANPSSISVSKPVKIMEIDFPARNVAQAEMGYFRFTPGQIAPVHHHLAPAIGLVAKGRIIYQAEGEQARVLGEGEPFYEPVGPSILRFDNMSATEQAIFIDFSLERKGEPFIAFDEKPSGPIDRTTLPTIDLGGISIKHVDVYTQDVTGSGVTTLDSTGPVIGIVSQGVIEFQIDNGKSQRRVAGETFSVTKSGVNAKIMNGSKDVTARIVTYRLR